ncbi:MAG: hypothetical protein LQ347_003538 [Umbilicaria vellea]|nr:MAG: hypothetical protein LQ347_003538 [Umbilicaria vellea]
MIIVDFEWAFDVGAVGCVGCCGLWVAVEDVVAVVGFGTFVDVVSPVSTWEEDGVTREEDEDEDWFVEEVRLRTRIAPKPAERVKFGEEQSRQEKLTYYGRLQL